MNAQLGGLHRYNCLCASAKSYNLHPIICRVVRELAAGKHYSSQSPLTEALQVCRDVVGVGTVYLSPLHTFHCTGEVMPIVTNLFQNHDGLSPPVFWDRYAIDIPGNKFILEACARGLGTTLIPQCTVIRCDHATQQMILIADGANNPPLIHILQQHAVLVLTRTACGCEYCKQWWLVYAVPDPGAVRIQQPQLDREFFRRRRHLQSFRGLRCISRWSRRRIRS